MKSIYTFLLNLLLVILVPAFNSYAQFNPGLGANFGIDGDILSGQNLNGSFSGNGSHDWFKKSGTGINVGLGMIDTSGNSIYAAKIATGENFTFSKGMAFPMFSNQGGYLVMDTRYARDNFGLSGASDKSDATT
ncbi:MAG: hypothetical protein LH619_06640 [Chitinophagaceae bacterium]|nr:hypothetical protein [Chitinophagaceae bacterium]